MRTLKYKTFNCNTCGIEYQMCISGMPTQGVCTKCRKKLWRKINPEPKKPDKHCKICNYSIGKNNKSFVCKKCYVRLNKDKIAKYGNEYEKKRKITDPSFKLSKHLRSRLSHAVKEGHHRLRLGSAIIDLGCSIDELKSYLKSKFTPGMTWDNYGSWHIDHIKPLSKFNLLDIEEFKLACHYTNLQPLWAKDNIKKSNKVVNP